MNRWAAVALPLVLAGAALGWLDRAPRGGPTGLLEVPPGIGAAALGRRLAAEGRIRSALWFSALARARGVDGRIKAGLYRLAPGRSASGLLRDVVAGRGETVRVTIPEGWARWQTAERLEATGVCPAAVFLEASDGQEGFLFPETYDFDPRSPAAVVVRDMRSRFDRAWEDVFRRAAAEGRVTGAPAAEEFRFADGRRWTRTQAVTLASLVEREARRADERPLVAAVYHNRLKKHMRLECDPTVQYALGRWKNPLYKKDLEIDSPYNTYRRFGLPPGPIAGPGRASLEAALAPAPVDFLYFVADESGGHRFSSTYEEHRRAVAARRRALKNNGKPLNFRED